MGKYRIMTLTAGVAVMLTSCISSIEDQPLKTPVSVWVTTADQSKLLQREEDIRQAASGLDAETRIVVNEAVTYQQMDGFGASLTDSSAWLIANRLNPDQRQQLMEKLFDRDKGIGISYLRLPMGASDFALRPYTYNDIPEGETDPELTRFTIRHDEEYIIPTLKQALSINPDLKLMGSPWSAPAWMKTSGSLIGGALKNDAYPTYANYFVKFIQSYQSHGLTIDAVTPQNEPHHVPADYPGMRMESFEQAEFIKHHLGPAFASNGIKTKIVIWDHNWDEPYYPMAVLNDPDAKKYIAGSAFHGYAGNVENQSKVRDAHPDKDIYFTESSGGQWAPEFAGNLKWDMQNLIIGATRNWARTVLKWNLALDESHGPNIGGCQNCRGMVTINQQTGDVTFNEEYYAFGHASKFVKPGARRIESATFGKGDIETVAFRNPDDSKVLIALNASSLRQAFQVQSGEISVSYTLPPGAAATFVWAGTVGVIP